MRTDIFVDLQNEKTLLKNKILTEMTTSKNVLLVELKLNFFAKWITILHNKHVVSNIPILHQTWHQVRTHLQRKIINNPSTQHTPQICWTLILLTFLAYTLLIQRRGRGAYYSYPVLVPLPSLRGTTSHGGRHT